MARACLCGVVECKKHGRRPSRNAGAYGADHQERRRLLLAEASRSWQKAICWRCGSGPRTDDPWEAGHVQDVVHGGGPEVRLEHRSCNRKAGARLAAERRRQKVTA